MALLNKLHVKLLKLSGWFWKIYCDYLHQFYHFEAINFSSPRGLQLSFFLESKSKFIFILLGIYFIILNNLFFFSTGTYGNMKPGSKINFFFSPLSIIDMQEIPIQLLQTTWTDFSPHFPIYNSIKAIKSHDLSQHSATIDL